MHVKGIAYLAREASMVQSHGAERWRSFIDAWRKEHPQFPATVLPISKIEADDFIALNDAMVRAFYGGDVTRAYWDFGEKSGQFALTQGQLKGLFQPGECRRFLQFTPAVYKGYFDGGEIKVIDHPQSVEIHIQHVPAHVYFEYSVLGFAKGALEVLGSPHPTPECVRGFSRGDPDIFYRFRI